MALTVEGWNAFTQPRAIALVGATDRASSISFTSRFLAAQRNMGYKGRVFFVNPTKSTLFGEPCWPSLAALPEPVEAVALSIPGLKAVETVKEAIAHGAKGLVIYTGGFAERGEEGRSLHDALEAACAGTGVAALGPNCLGIHSFTHRTAFGAMRVSPDPQAGPIAVISQSGASAAILAGIAQPHGISFLASTGNEAITTTEDLIGAAIDDPATKLILTFVEALRRPEELYALGRRALKASKPIIMLKVGLTSEGGQVSHGHTGAIAGSGEVYRQALAQAGIVLVEDFDEMAQTAELFARVRPGAGRCRLGLLGTSGGELANAADVAVRLGIELPTLSQGIQAEIQEIQSLPSDVFQRNPVDVGTGFTSKSTYHDRMRACIQSVAADPAIDVVALLQGFGRDNQDLSLSLNYSMLSAAVAEAPSLAKPLLILASRSGRTDPAITEPVRQAGLPLLEGTREACRALIHLRRYEQDRIQGDVAPMAVADVQPPPHWPSGMVSQADVFALLHDHGLPITAVRRVSSVAEAEQATIELGPLVVIKVDTPRIVHKSDVGGVALGVTAETVAERFRGLQAVIAGQPGDAMPGEGLVIAPQRAVEAEFYIGAKRDPTFGAVIACGMGGRLLELLGRTALLVAPFDHAAARAAIERSGAATFLSGYRGGVSANLDGLAEIITKAGTLALALGSQLEELDLNPVVISSEYPAGCIVDARLILTTS